MPRPPVAILDLDRAAVNGLFCFRDLGIIGPMRATKAGHAAGAGAGAAKSVRLTPAVFSQGLAELASRDGDLARVLERIGPPPMWARKPGFGTLLHIILEQQVSLASAQAAYDKLLALGQPLTPERFLTYDDDTLHTAGFSRQKARYGRILAQAVGDGSLKLHRLSGLDDHGARPPFLTIN